MAGFIQTRLFVGHQIASRSSHPTSTTSFGTGLREWVRKISSDRCGDARTLCKEGRLKEVLHILNQQGIQPDSNTYAAVLEECMNTNGLAEGKQVHAHIIRNGFKPDVIVFNTLIKMYAKCGSVVDARQVFDKMPARDLFTWAIMIAGYTKHGCGCEALHLYEQMQQEGFTPNRVTFICILNACASLGALEKGKEVHTDIVKSGIVPDMILDTALAGMYAKCGSMKDAQQVFENMAKRDVISWSAMIAGYVRHGCGKEAFNIYEQMQREGLMPNRVTFISVLNACASLGALEKGKEVHTDIKKAGIASYINLENSLVSMYAECGSITDARQVFNNMVKRDVVSWNAMITGYSQNGCGREAFKIYEQMQKEGLTPDRITFISVLNACANLGALEKGKEAHADIVKVGIAPHIILENALVDMYAKCGSMKDARQVFDGMAKRNVVSWSVMIAGYAQNGCSREAFEIYNCMQWEGVMPDMVTFICVLNACASLGALDKGKEVHAHIMKAGMASYVNLDNALINMYAKCGSVKNAGEVFDNMAQRNVVSWSAMIAAYAQHGYGREALKSFEQMQQVGLKPDSVTFVSVLSACSHVGLLDEGHYYFQSISRDNGISPTLEHFACMVDLFGRAGQLVEAEDFISKMPIKPDASVWGSFLGACRLHGDLALAERAAMYILELDSQHIAT